MTKNIMIVGVGGQGTLLASRILGNTVITEGYDVKVSEVHGMSQRGGSVVTYVKYGAMPDLKKGGKMIVNTQEIAPMPVITGAAKYPENIAEKLAANLDVTCVDALSLAMEAGNSKAVNVVLIGLMAKNTDIAYEKWVETIRTTVPEKFLDVNLKAFDLGYYHE